MKTLLFQPGDVREYSETFRIPLGGQVTVVAMGLEAGETVSFEIIDTPAIVRDPCACPPGKVELPQAGAKSDLTCCRVGVKLRAINPYAVMDSPQGVNMRAKLNAANSDDIWVWLTESDTPYLTNDMRGCACPIGIIHA